MNTPFKILVVNTTEQSGGAARAAWRILEACDGDGFRIQELVKVKQSSDARVVDLKQFQPQGRLFQLGDWMAKKVKNQYYKYVWKHYPKREAVFLSDLRSTRFYDALNTLDYDILHLHWVNLRFLNLGLLKEVKKPWTKLASAQKYSLS